MKIFLSIEKTCQILSFCYIANEALYNLLWRSYSCIILVKEGSVPIAFYLYVLHTRLAEDYDSMNVHFTYNELSLLVKKYYRLKPEKNRMQYKCHKWLYTNSSVCNIQKLEHLICNYNIYKYFPLITLNFNNYKPLEIHIYQLVVCTIDNY